MRRQVRDAFVKEGLGFEAVGQTLLELQVKRTALDAKVRQAEWYNDDANFQKAVGEVMEAKEKVLRPASRCARSRRATRRA